MSKKALPRIPHLPSLSITGFRGIDHVTIPRLGSVTLLAGKNGIGKTTILDAVRVYASRGLPSVLQSLLSVREEFATTLDEEHDTRPFPDYVSLFHGRDIAQLTPISIGPVDPHDQLVIATSCSAGWPDEQQELFDETFSDFLGEADVKAIKLTFRKQERLLAWFVSDGGRYVFNEAGLPGEFKRRLSGFRKRERSFDFPTIDCESLGPGLPNNTTLARFWDSVALTEQEQLTIDALRLVLGDSIDRIAIVGDDSQRFRPGRRRAVVKLTDHPSPVPLKSLGDGAIRMFALGLAIANCRDGFLLVDEAENGIHYTVQQNIWNMIFNSTRDNNVQVLATTHSDDCVKGFARAAVQHELEGVLVRIERHGDGMRSIEYNEDDLWTIAEQGIEVR